MSWQPIETAPKDGTQALFYQPGNPESIARGARTEKMRVDFQKGEGLFYREFPESRYTHWMPLPKPPSTP